MKSKTKRKIQRRLKQGVLFGLLAVFAASSFYAFYPISQPAPTNPTQTEVDPSLQEAQQQAEAAAGATATAPPSSVQMQQSNPAGQAGSGGLQQTGATGQ